MDKVPKRKIVSVNFWRALLFWNSWSLKMGPIGCAETFVRNYRSTLQSISEKRRSHTVICWCRPWFGLHDLVQSDPVWHGAVQHVICIFKLTSCIWVPNLRGKPSSCSRVNMVIVGFVLRVMCCLTHIVKKGDMDICLCGVIWHTTFFFLFVQYDKTCIL